MGGRKQIISSTCGVPNGRACPHRIGSMRDSHDDPEDSVDLSIERRSRVSANKGYIYVYMGAAEENDIEHCGAPNGRACPSLRSAYGFTKGRNHDDSVSSSRARYPRASYHRLDAEAIRSSSASSPSRPVVTLRSVGIMLKPLPAAKNPPQSIDVLRLLKCLFGWSLGEHHARWISRQADFHPST